MGVTDFPHGISSMGIPLLGGGGFPHNSGGSHYFVDSVNGNDGNEGTTWESAFKSIPVGYAYLTANKNDVLHVAGGATAYAHTAILPWAKDYTHMVGHTAPIKHGGRVRLTNTVTSATAGEYTISGTGCVFQNIHWQFGDSATATSLVGVAISGNGRNAFIGCHFYGPFDAGIGAAVGQRMLTVTSSQDNLFYGCSFGQRTILNTSATGAIVSFNGSNNTNNFFEKCLFQMYNSNTGSCAINYVDGAMPGSGFTVFDDCIFNGSAGIAVADVIRYTTSSVGETILKNCALTGAGLTVWATGAWKAVVNVCTPAGGATGGLGIHPA